MYHCDLSCYLSDCTVIFKTEHIVPISQQEAPRWRKWCFLYVKLAFLFQKGVRGPNPEILHIWNLYRIFIFHPLLMCFVSFELIVFRTSYTYIVWQTSSSISYSFQGQLNWKGSICNKCQTPKFEFSYFSSKFNADFLLNDHLYELLMKHCSTTGAARSCGCIMMHPTYPFIFSL